MSITEKRVVTPNDLTIRKVFGQQKSFFIDIYQREYRWQDKQVQTLLNDIEMRFGLFPRAKHGEPKIVQEDVATNFDPYYVNTFLTHATVDGKLSIIDGQQRLTTFLLILIKLRKIVQEVESVFGRGKTFTADKLEKLIFEQDDFGNADRFKIFNTNREEILRKLVEGEIPEQIETKGETQKRLVENFKIISEYYDSYLKTHNGDKWDVDKITYYIAYLLDKIAIVEIKVEQQRDIAMIFEVVNDRGMELEAYEILKGKLIGNLPEDQKEQANNLWTELQNRYYGAIIENSSESTTISLDNFFRTYLRAKFANSEKDYEKYERDYHYEMIYRNPQLRDYFHNFRDANTLYRFITSEMKYFADLYYRLRTSYEYEFIIYNKLVNQNQQTYLILSAVSLYDPLEHEKIMLVSKKFDQLHVVLRLLEAYDSNSFQRIVYKLAGDIRAKGLDEIRDAFDKTLISTLIAEEKIPSETLSVTDIFKYERFSKVRNTDANFSKYVLMRIDRYLAKLLDKPSYTKDGSLRDLENHFNKTTRRKYGMHLEHIIASNEENRKLFTNPESGIFDEAAYHEARNKLGVVLLLKDRQNESSNNATYERKFVEYGQSNFIWNEWLVGDIHTIDSRALPDWGVKTIRPNPDKTFPLAEIDGRQKAVFNAICAVWNF